MPRRRTHGGLGVLTDSADSVVNNNTLTQLSFDGVGVPGYKAYLMTLTWRIGCGVCLKRHTLETHRRRPAGSGEHGTLGQGDATPSDDAPRDDGSVAREAASSFDSKRLRNACGSNQWMGAEEGLIRWKNKRLFL